MQKLPLVKMLYQVSGVLLKLSHIQAGGRSRGRSHNRTHPPSKNTNPPDVKVSVVDVSQSKEVCSGEDFYAMRKGTLTSHILLEGSLAGNTRR